METIGRISSPLGPVRVALDGGGRLRQLEFVDVPDGAADPALPAGLDVARRLSEYFAGDLDVLDGLAVDLGGTDFQRRVWAALREIPVGEVATYGEIAAEVGVPGGARAAGGAIGANPVAVVVPCHRVVARGGAIGGYGGGLDRKRWLLRHEGATAHLSVAS